MLIRGAHISNFPILDFFSNPGSNFYIMMEIVDL